MTFFFLRLVERARDLAVNLRGPFFLENISALCPWPWPRGVGPWPWIVLCPWPWPRALLFDSTSTIISLAFT